MVELQNQDAGGADLFFKQGDLAGQNLRYLFKVLFKRLPGPGGTGF